MADGNEFVLAEELYRVWTQNPLKVVALEVMGKTILGCYHRLNPNLFAGMNPAEEGEELVLQSCRLFCAVPLKDMFLESTWCQENQNTMNLFKELDRTLTQDVVAGSVNLLLDISYGSLGDSLVMFSLVYLERRKK